MGACERGTGSMVPSSEKAGEMQVLAAPLPCASPVLGVHGLYLILTVTV